MCPKLCLVFTGKLILKIITFKHIFLCFCLFILMQVFWIYNVQAGYVEGVFGYF